MFEESIIIHEISQEIQSMVLIEKWFPNFFHTLMNYKINNGGKVSNKYFPYDNLTTDIVRDVLNTIEYESECMESDIDYIIMTCDVYVDILKNYLKNKSLDDILAVKTNNNNLYYYFKLPPIFKINQLRLDVNHIEDIMKRFPNNTKEDVIGLLLRFTLTSNYSWSSRSISNATTLMVPNILHNYIKSLDENYLECFSCVLNTNTNNYCSLFDIDRIFYGCQGTFCLETLERVKPKLLFANPPYDNGTVSNMLSILYEYHKKNKALSIITINRKDGGLYDKINESNNKDIYEGLLDLLSNKNKLIDILVIPNYLMSYELVIGSSVKILGIKRDTSFIIYGDNVLNIDINDMKENIIKLIYEFRNQHNKKKRVKYNNKNFNKTNIPFGNSHRKSIIENHKLLSKIFK